MRCIIHKQLKEKDTNKFLKLLEYYEKELPDYNQAKMEQSTQLMAFIQATF